MILGNLYESLSEGVTQLKNLASKPNLLLSGPFWLLQLWLNATFEASLPHKKTLDENAEEIRHRRVEGTRLVCLTPSEEGHSLRPLFLSFINMFAKRYEFSTSMAPFAARKIGPEWFTRSFPPLEKDQEEEAKLVWEAFLIPRLLTLRLNLGKGQVALVSYQPNLVSR